MGAMVHKRHRNRRGKIVTGGHSSIIEGLADYLKELERWPEISSIRLGRIQHTPAKAGGGFNFRVNRWARIGPRVTGIKCTAMFGGSTQDVVLMGEDLEALKKRLGADF